MIILRHKLYSFKSESIDLIDLGDNLSLVKTKPTIISKILGKLSKRIREQQGLCVIYDIMLSSKNIGYIMLNKESGEEINIPWFFIDSNYQNNGYGTKALMAIIKYMRKLGYKWLTLEVPVENKQAQHIYEKLGFKYTGETIKCYDEDSLKLMKLKLK